MPDETKEPKEDELLHIESIVTMATSVPPDLSHALVTTPISIEVRQMAVHEPDHNLSTTNPSSDKDKKLPRDDSDCYIIPHSDKGRTYHHAKGRPYN